MRATGLFVALCVVAALLPVVHKQEAVEDSSGPSFPGWPTTYEGRPLTPLALTDRETRFLKGFPGWMAKFSDGRRLILMRWVRTSTRKLHPASDCFRGAGYVVRPEKLVRDSDGTSWGCFTGTKGKEAVRVLERIRDSTGRCWTDVSAWYWASLMQRSSGPWWAVTIVEARPVHDGKQPYDHQAHLSVDASGPLPAT